MYMIDKPVPFKVRQKTRPSDYNSLHVYSVLALAHPFEFMVP